MAAEITILNSLKDKLELEDIKQIMDTKLFLQPLMTVLDDITKKLEEQVDGFGALNTDIVQAVYLAEDIIDNFHFGTAFQKQGVFHSKKDQFVKNMGRAVKDLGEKSHNLDVQKSLKRFASNVQNRDKKSDSLDAEGRAKELAEFIVNSHSPFHIFVVEDSTKKYMLSKIYNTEDVKKQFACRACVRLSDDFGKEKILSDMLNQVTGSKGERKIPLESSLKQELREKRYLIVLFDVPTPDIWEIIKNDFPNSSNGSRIIFSFQEADAARYPDIKFFGRELLGLKWEDTEFASTQSKNFVGDDIDKMKNINWEVRARLDGAFKYLDKDDGNDIVGLKDKLLELGQLTLKTSENHFLISVVGLAGSGKTTLVKTFFDNSFVKQLFGCRAWVDLYAFQDLEMSNVLMEILKQVSEVKEEDESTDLEKLGTKLTQILNVKRFLIVLDNVYALNVWYHLETIVSKNTNTGSRVILITRDAYLARCFGLSVARLELDLLKEDDGWKLFLKKAKKDKTLFLKEENKDKSSEQDQKKLENTIRKIVWKKCCGLPLALCVLGGVLYSKKLNNISEWPQEIEKIMPGGEEKEDFKLQDMNEDHSISEDVLSSLGKLDPSQIWALGYKDLSPHLKACLHYSSLFPKSYEIPVRRIRQLWVAEGLVKDEKQTAPEEVVKKYFEELVNRNMIEVAKLRLDGTAKTCRIPITLRDAFYPDAQEKGIFHIHSKSESPSTSKNLNIRRLAEHFDIKVNPPSDKEIEYLRSFISFKTRKSDKPAKEVRDLLNKTITKRSGFGLLRVLDLEGVYKPVLPELGKLPLLTYVGLRWTFLDEFPDSVGELSNLETLDVKHTNITTLPISIWKVKKLRHLYMNEIHFEFPKKMSSGDSLPDNVQTLRGLLIGIKKPPEYWLKSLKSLKKLGLTCHSKSIGDITAWIRTLTDLRTLRLRSVYDDSEPSDLKLGSIEVLPHLTELYLLGKFSKEIKESPLPQSLKILTLSVSNLKDDPMPQLGKLENLNILRLLAQSYIGEKMICEKNKFPKLRVLKIWVLKELKEWTIEKGAMPVLSELEIRYCPKLEKIEGLENLSTLKELKLTNMKEEFASEVKKIISEHTNMKKEFASEVEKIISEHIINIQNLETHPPWD